MKATTGPITAGKMSMGVLVPENFDLRSLRNDAERTVVTAFRDRLNDGWLVMPSLRIHSTFDYELDIVLVHRDYGVIDIEVKGHRIHLFGGMWTDASGPLQPQPMDQARDNAYRLRRLLRSHFPDELEHLAVHYGVALPNTVRIEGKLPPGYTENQILIAEDLEDPSPKLQMIVAEGVIGPPLTDRHVESFVGLLFPDAEFVWDESARVTRLRHRLEELSAAQIKALEPLDANRRVLVTGAAGSGKTRLGCAWARRALSRDERVLFVCFNEPLADEIASRFLPDEYLTTGAFLQVSRRLDGMPPLEVPRDMDPETAKYFWNVTMAGHLHANWPLITEQFDTIVIDEAQDFSPAWIAQLEALLDPEGPRRMMLVADAAQDVFNRGFTLPSNEDGWSVGELTTNCRNSLEIAQLLRRFLSGAAAPMTIPPGSGIGFHAVGSDSATSLLGAILPEISHPLTAAVIVDSNEEGNLLRETFGLGTWNARHERVVCESVRRLKGTEFDAVVVYDPRGVMDEQQLYVAVSRAISRLDVIGPPELGRRLGFDT